MMEFRYHYGGEEHCVQLERLPDGRFRARIGDRSTMFELQRAGEGQLNLCVEGRRVHAYHACMQTEQLGTSHHMVALVDREVCTFDLVKVTGATRRRTAAVTGGGLAAQMPGQVMDVRVAEGDPVQAGQVLLILEAMKMEMRITAPLDGRVTRLYVGVGDTVERGQQLVEVIPDAPTGSDT